VGVDVGERERDSHRNAEGNGSGWPHWHQLRAGRIGAARTKSFCILISDVLTEERASAAENSGATNDGFKIAERI